MRQTNRDLTACVTSEISCLLQSNIDAFQNLTTVLRESGPGLGQCRPPNIANQERYVQLAFQSRHRLRDHGCVIPRRNAAPNMLPASATATKYSSQRWSSEIDFFLLIGSGHIL